MRNLQIVYEQKELCRLVVDEVCWLGHLVAVAETLTDWQRHSQAHCISEWGAYCLPPRWRVRWTNLAPFFCPFQALPFGLTIARSASFANPSPTSPSWRSQPRRRQPSRRTSLRTFISRNRTYSRRSSRSTARIYSTRCGARVTLQLSLSELTCLSLLAGSLPSHPRRQ